MNLRSLIETNTTIELSKASSELLTDIQKALVKIRLYPLHQVDGRYGPLTKAGWERFKESANQGDLHLVGPGSARLLLERIKEPSLITQPLPNSNLANKIYNICLAREYPLDLRPGAVNIFGLEGLNTDGSKNDDAPDRWNDSVGILSMVEGVPKVLCIYRGTTEPGRYYTMNPMNRGGAARLQLGHHKDLWMVGQHRGYEAMQQVGAATLVRDHNRNFLRDGRVTVERNIGINLHTTRTTGWRGSYNSFVGQWSAGCVLIMVPSEFLTFMRLVKGSLQYRQSRAARFDFTLLWRDWF
jgi:hypothetical protein